MRLLSFNTIYPASASAFSLKRLAVTYGKAIKTQADVASGPVSLTGKHSCLNKVLLTTHPRTTLPGKMRSNTDFLLLRLTLLCHHTVYSPSRLGRDQLSHTEYCWKKLFLCKGPGCKMMLYLLLLSDFSYKLAFISRVMLTFTYNSEICTSKITCKLVKWRKSQILGVTNELKCQCVFLMGIKNKIKNKMYGFVGKAALV